MLVIFSTHNEFFIIHNLLHGILTQSLTDIMKVLRYLVHYKSKINFTIDKISVHIS